MKLSALDPGGAFALLGPGFIGGGAGDGGFALLRALQASPVDHPRTRLVFAPYPRGEDPPQAFEAEVERFGSLELDVTPARLAPRLEERGFAQAIEAIHARIADGDVYQVNLTQRCALGTHTQSMADFVADIQSDGLTGALDRRDSKFGDYRTTGKSTS